MKTAQRSITKLFTDLRIFLNAIKVVLLFLSKAVKNSKENGTKAIYSLIYLFSYFLIYIYIVPGSYCQPMKECVRNPVDVLKQGAVIVHCTFQEDDVDIKISQVTFKKADNNKLSISYRGYSFYLYFNQIKDKYSDHSSRSFQNITEYF